VLAGLALCAAATDDPAGAVDAYRALIKIETVWQEEDYIAGLRGWSAREIAELQKLRLVAVTPVDPIAMKPTLLLFILMAPLWAAPVDLGTPIGRTPYDPYFGPVRTTLGGLGGAKPPLDSVRDYVKTAKGFRYYMKDPYLPQTPEETETSKAGDCKAKSLWVAAKMGDKSVRFVVGKARRVSNMSHAWLLWAGPEGWLILDATNFSAPLDPNKLSTDEFIPLYSFTAGAKYIHNASVGSGQSKYGDHL